MEGNTELVFFIAPYIGHITQAVELAKLMIHCDDRISITFLLVKLPAIDFEVNSFIDSLPLTSTKRLHFLHLPPVKPKPEWSAVSRGAFMTHLISHHKPNVRNFVTQRFVTDASTSPRLGGFVVDTQCTSSIVDLADEFGAPTYAFFTSGAAFLGLTLLFQTLQDEVLKEDITSNYLKKSELSAPCIAKPVPTSVLPVTLMDTQTWNTRFLHYARGYKKAKGIIVNTFNDLESFAMSSLSDQGSTCYGSKPNVYPVGPIINKIMQYGSEDITKWLDKQPPTSVVFLCFGSMGSTQGEQVHEIADGLERSGSRFLWVLRRPPAPGVTVDFPADYTNYEDVLPKGFLDRTKETGKVVGWVPQLAVLSHRAVGGFVSHCGWNSILESLWCGVPIGTWPLYAEQKLNAFQLVHDLGLSVEITPIINNPKLEDKANDKVVRAEQIEKGIKNLMSDGEVRKKVAEMKEACHKALKNGGSAKVSLGNLIQDVIKG
ncbi:hypothetical protein DCAR_0625096 [Daucus carota subsp. sativus]|uniref:Glycosyltransferase n=1 Tax=Daucus carota subsp. sativus TaxID=79200 RepID=A0A161ZWK1_DAUCS|nr:PREDICTED: anthocyanidin 3-O-glucosyltransferase 2-like [Daucus carota subsp. sativus]WOH05676.1 hypothetical protein DCAR_0625096 [Daucus carota subsp. sativus]